MTFKLTMKKGQRAKWKLEWGVFPWKVSPWLEKPRSESVWYWRDKMSKWWERRRAAGWETGRLFHQDKEFRLYSRCHWSSEEFSERRWNARFTFLNVHTGRLFPKMATTILSSHRPSADVTPPLRPPVFPPFKCGQALWLALTNRMQQKWSDTAASEIGSERPCYFFFALSWCLEPTWKEA